VPQLLCTVLQIYVIVVFARIIMSWFPISPGSAMAPIFSFLYAVTEPVLGPIRRMLPPLNLGGMGLDLSPIIVLVLITVLQRAICG
jgi:YggT family protein